MLRKVIFVIFFLAVADKFGQTVISQDPRPGESLVYMSAEADSRLHNYSLKLPGVTQVRSLGGRYYHLRHADGLPLFSERVKFESRKKALLAVGAEIVEPVFEVEFHEMPGWDDPLLADQYHLGQIGLSQSMFDLAMAPTKKPHKPIEFGGPEGNSKVRMKKHNQPESVYQVVIDSGVDVNHPDLRVNTELSRGFAKDADPLIDTLGHGTHVSGIACGLINNEIGIAGINPQCEIVSFKVTNPGNGMDSVAILEALLAVRGITGQGHKVVVNMSFGSMIFSELWHQAIAETDAQFIASSGNSPGITLWYPCGFSQMVGNLVCVGGITATNGLLLGTTHGKQVSIAAYAMDVLSTLPGGYGYKSGTSMAAPQVAGVAGLLFVLAEKNGWIDVSPNQITEALKAGRPNPLLEGWKGNPFQLDASFSWDALQMILNNNSNNEE